MASQKYWEDDVQISDGSGSISIDYDQEEEVLSKAECEVFLFRERLERGLMRMAQLYLGLACLSLSLSVLT